MSDVTRGALFWTPRVLSIIFLAFLSLFALDVFEGRLGFWQTMQALFMHLIPVFVLLVILILAWRWEWIGAAFYGLAGLFYVGWVVLTPRPFPPVQRLVMIILIAGPALVIAALFLANWLRRSGLQNQG